jgi:hydrogenase maturation protease
MTVARDGRVLVAGVGNVFLGDDGFGVEVARRLAERGLGPGVHVADYGISGVHLAYELLDGGYETLILIDALPIGEVPGTVVVVEPAALDDDDDVPLADGHRMDPCAVLRLLHTLGGVVDRVLIVGCEPGLIDEGIGLTPEVLAAVDGAVHVVEELTQPGARQSAGVE